MNLTNPDTFSIEPVIGALRIAGGMRLEGAAPHVTVLTPPPKAARGRGDERLFLLLDLTPPASAHLYRELREIVARTYWSTVGSITAGLRRAAAAANRYLFQVNLRSASAERCYGGLTCAVLHGDDLFILQAGPAQACALRQDRLICFPRDEKLSHLGIRALVDVRLHHVFVAAGDMLLLASSALIREAGGAGLARVLPRADMREVLAGLEQVGASADFSALVVRWTLAEKAPLARRPEAATSALAEPSITAPVEPPEPRRRVVERDPRAARVKRAEPPLPRPEPTREPGPGLGERMRYLGRGLAYAGRGVVAAGAGLAGGVGALFRRMLPGPERESHRQAPPRRPLPEENRALMAAVAIGIPILMVIVVALAYLGFGEKERVRTFIVQTEAEVAQALAAEDTPEEARPHWEAALAHAREASRLQPDDQAVTALQAQAQDALDRLDGVTRLAPIQLWDFGSGALPRQLVVHGQTIFVLDPAGGWGVRLTLNSAGDGVVEESSDSLLVRTGQQIGDDSVGDLVDFVWVDRGDERRTSVLLILEESGALSSYDPAWMDEGGGPRLKRFFLGAPPTGSPRAIGAFEGRFYVLDTLADGSGQIWRYQPLGDTYPEPPERYFADPPPKPLTEALDVAIDGNIYLLYTGGTILKFLGGEPEPFDVRDLPGDLGQAVAFAVDADGSSDRVYVADRGGKRVVVLEPDGAFRLQFCAEGAFDDLEALAVDETARRLYLLGGGRLYVASLP